MKTPFYKITWLFLLLALSHTAWASMYIEKKKTIRKSFAVNETTEVEINSKYGTINVQPWTKDSVAFRISIVGKSKTEEFSQEMVDDTEIHFSNNSAYIIMNASFDDEGAALLTTINKVASSVSGSKSELEVNITVYMPQENAIKINQKFGDIIIGSRNGKVDITSNYCDVKIGDLSGYTNLKIMFGDLNAQNVKRLNLECSYADIVAFKIENADINSKGSKINLHEVSRLRARTNRDDYTIYKAGSVNADGSYSDFVITELAGNLNFNGKFGDITIHNILASFTQITMNCERSNSNLSFNESCKFSIDLNLEMGDFSYPQGLLKITEKEETEGEKVKYFGYVGDNPKPSASVEIFGKDTDVNITLK